MPGALRISWASPTTRFDRRALFQAEVVDPFVDGYLAGETPSPCVRCNRGVKIRELLALADSLGAVGVATGHYARIGGTAQRPRLLRAVDSSKDQSYFLHMLGKETLRRLRFPLGDATKAEVRSEAERLGLPGASKGESQELCFVPTGRYDAFVTERASDRVRPGPIVDAAGREVGRHQGVHGFTRGQRKNLGHLPGISGLCRGYRSRQRSRRGRPSGAARVAARGCGGSQPVRRRAAAPALRSCGALPRSPRAGHAASDRGGLSVELDDLVPAVVPGQYAVFYRGEEVLGGGVIRSAERVPEAP